MASTLTPSDLVAQLKNPGVSVLAEHATDIELSPPLVLAAALLYMMLSNGEVEKSEIDQLQSVIGKNADLLRCATDYVKSVPVEQFIADAPHALSVPDRLCVLTNMCDAMLSDGQADPAELDLLARLTDAFGFSDEEFQPYFEVIALKNDKTVLGDFDAERLATQQATPHLAMAASLIYMMASDGSLGPEEIGRLQTMIGEFEGLQKVAVKYALKVKSDKFYASAARFLDADQKLFILANVCDIMLADGTVEAAEEAVFNSVRTAFGYTEEAFEPYYQAVLAKNLKSFTTDDFTYARDSSLADDSDPDDVFSSPGSSIYASANAGGQGGSRSSVGGSVSRVMRANIVKVSSDFGSAKKLSRISDNSHFRTSVDRGVAFDGFAYRAQDRSQGPSFDAEPSQTSTRRPIGSAGRGHTADTRRPSATPYRPGAFTQADPAQGQVQAEEQVQNPQTDGVPGRAMRMLNVLALKQARLRLKAARKVNAAIRKQLEHYDATGTLLQSPDTDFAADLGPESETSTAPALQVAAAPTERPKRSFTWAAWRVAVPVAIVSSVLMAGTATVLASLAAPQAAVVRSEAPTYMADLRT
jgi:uncharacterized tellurite resistance protein B-like protein